MKKLPSLSVFFPVYNDAKSIPYLVAKTLSILPQITSVYEIILINDGSTDDSKDICEYFAKTNKRIRYIEHKKNKGYGAVLRRGIKESRYSWVFYTDGDGQYDPSDLSLLISLADSKTDVINGYKKNRSDSLVRVIIGKIYNLFAHRANTLPISDIDCDFRLMRNSMLKKISLTSTTGYICIELIAKLHAANARFSECGVNHYPRIHGKSQFFQYTHLLNTARDILHAKKKSVHRLKKKSIFSLKGFSSSRLQ